MDAPILMPDQVFVLLYNLLIAVGGGFLTSTVVVSAVALVKFLPGFKLISGGTLQVFFAVLTTIIFWIASRLGFADAFNSTLDFLKVLLPAVIAFLPTVVGAQKLYVSLRENAIPGVGAARTLPDGVAVQK